MWENCGYLGRGQTAALRFSHKIVQVLGSEIVRLRQFSIYSLDQVREDFYDPKSITRAKAPRPVPGSSSLPRKEAALHFIESLFGLSPDGGTGVAELIFLVALIAVALTVVRRVVRC
jgi:hypothetical protein